MKEYIGTKKVSAKPMTRQEYNTYRDWTMPDNEDGNDEGYLVKYSDGYESWSPKKQFEESYRETNGLTLGLAIDYIKLGFKVARHSWDNSFIYYVAEGAYPARMDCIKGEFENDLVPYQPYIALKTEQGDVVPWAASQTDLLAEDFYVVPQEVERVKKQTKVVAGFPGVGKSYYFQTSPRGRKISDSDSSLFSWIIDDKGDKVRNPNFVEEYMNHIQLLIDEEYDVVFVSTHKDVIQGMLDRGIEFTVVKPRRDCKEAFLQRYKDRGSDEAFITLMDNKWDEFLDDLEVVQDKAPYVLISEMFYIDSALVYIGSDFTEDVWEFMK